MGVQKLLLPFGGGTLIGHIAGEILRSPVDRIFVIVGQDAARVTAALAAAPGVEGTGHRIEIITNPDPGSEMLSSVRCGLRALPPDCEAVLVALGDQPSITADLVGRMVSAFRASARGIVVPVYAGRGGHPILFRARYRQEVLSRFDDVGLRGLRQAHPEDVLELDSPDPAVLSDMDYPADYRRELARLAGDGPAPPAPLEAS
jgi:molybdenum cofactor cytidylyltransferase